ncbi:MAG: hypothetical protein WCH77_07360 [Planctomycetota bacterium]
MEMIFAPLYEDQDDPADLMLWLTAHRKGDAALFIRLNRFAPRRRSSDFW